MTPKRRLGVQQLSATSKKSKRSSSSSVTNEVHGPSTRQSTKKAVSNSTVTAQTIPPNPLTADHQQQQQSEQLPAWEGGVPPPVLEQVSSTIATNGESDPLPLITYNDIDVFISDSMKQKIWNNEYIDLALLLKQNFSPNSDCSGTLTVVNNQLTIKTANPKIKVPINSIELWTDAFLNYLMVFGLRHKEKVQDLLKYLSVIRGAAGNNPIHKWLTYDMQFRLRLSKDPEKLWSGIDGHLWLSCGLSGDVSAMSDWHGPCYEYNFKGFCMKFNCQYAHTCINCKIDHPACNCNLYRSMRYQTPFRLFGNSAAPRQGFTPQTFMNRAAFPAPTPGQRYQGQYKQFRPYFRRAESRPQWNRQPRPSPFRPQTRHMGPW